MYSCIIINNIYGVIRVITMMYADREENNVTPYTG